MRFWTLFLFCCVHTVLVADDELEVLPSSSEQIAKLGLDTETLVAGLVSPLTGQLSLVETDIIAKGAEDVILRRVYIPPHVPDPVSDKPVWEEYRLIKHLNSTYQGWVVAPHAKAWFYFANDLVRITDPNGVTLDFSLKEGIAKLISPTYGMSNISEGIPSGRYDLRNTQVRVSDNKKTITVEAPDGTVRYYNHLESRTSRALYLLEKERLPHGKLLRYHYVSGHLKLIESKDENDLYVYASIRLEYNPSSIDYISSSGKKTSYYYEERKKIIDVKDKHRRVKTHEFLPALLSKVSSPFYRNEEMQYCPKHLLGVMLGKENIFHCIHKRFKGHKIPAHLRIFQLKLPVGSGDTFEPMYEFDYDLPRAGKKEGITRVKISDGRESVYHFSKDLFLEKQEHKDKDGRVQKEKLYRMRQSEDHWLESFEIKNGSGECLHKKRFTYDRFGNPFTESFIGNLTGEGVEESYIIWRHYSEDGKHLLLKEDHEDGRSYDYEYLPGTNLVTAKFSVAFGRVYVREFFEYDACNNLIKKICDDGSVLHQHNLVDVTERHITTYILRQEQPFLHMPEWIEESCLEGPLKKTKLHYDDEGNIARKDIYDAHGQFVYSLEWTYNERGDVMTESNPLGSWKHFNYDTRGRKCFESSFGGSLVKTTTHDLRGRVKQVKDAGGSISQVTHYGYDKFDNLTFKKDHFSNTTMYDFDPFVKKPSHIQYPEISFKPVIQHFQYDPLGRMLSSVNPRGFATTTQYNFYSSPTHIEYSNGSSESFVYYKNGKLKQHEDREGLITFYTYDPLYRIETKTYISKEGEEIGKETFTYSSFHLKTFTDKEGHVTTYDYDGAGRKIREERSGRVTFFSFDSLGKLSKITEGSLITEFTYDFLDQMLEKKQTDAKGNLLSMIRYSYNKDGKLENLTTYPNSEEAVDTFFYDPLGRQIEHHDPLGFIEKTTYNEGGNFLEIIETDKKGFKTLKTYDAHSNLIKKETPLGVTTLSYDPCSNLIEKQDDLGNDKTQKIRYNYTSLDEIKTLTRAAETEYERKTTYAYTPSGKIKTKTLPDGIILDYSYDSFGFLRELFSSDKTIDHTFSYNRLGHLLYAEDHVTGIFIKRIPDPFGNILFEQFSTDLFIKKTYDRFNRPLTLELPTGGHIQYTYDPLYLRKIERFSKGNDLRYVHTYDDYDLSGKLTAESLIDDLGERVRAYDKAGRICCLSSPYLSEECTYDASGNLEQLFKNGVFLHYSYDALSQISSEPHNNYAYDTLYNRIKKNDLPGEINPLNELEAFGKESYAYDARGNMVKKGEFRFSYDALNRLKEVSSPDVTLTFLYDPLGRRLIKNSASDTERYLYDGEEEIGAITPCGCQKNLKIGTAVIELENRPFVPVFDAHNNICGLINPLTKKLSAEYIFTAFGEELRSHESLFNPWRYASKRLDPETNLIYFGKRYYFPELGRWLTTDPAGFIDGTNLYQYVYNNPFRYTDPNGQFAIPLLIWGASVIFPSLTTIATTALYTAVATTATYLGYKAVQFVNNYNSQSSNDASIWLLATSMWGRVEDLEMPSTMHRKKKGGIDETLPTDPFNDPNLEDVSHPDAKKEKHYKFKDKRTGEIVQYDEAVVGEAGHEGRDHYHRPNPNSKNKGDYYLDSNGNPVPKGSEASHLYPPEWVWWK